MSSSAGASIPFSVGTPHGNTGSLQLFESIDEVEASTLTVDGDVNDEHVRVVRGCVVCLLSVPSFMIPGDVLQFFGSVIDSIVAVHIVLRAPGTSDKASQNGAADRLELSPSPYMCLLVLRTEALARQLVRHFHGHPVTTTLEPTRCRLYSVRALQLDVPPSSSATAAPASASSTSATLCAPGSVPTAAPSATRQLLQKYPRLACTLGVASWPPSEPGPAAGLVDGVGCDGRSVLLYSHRPKERLVSDAGTVTDSATGCSVGGGVDRDKEGELVQVQRTLYARPPAPSSAEDDRSFAPIPPSLAPSAHERTGVPIEAGDASREEAAPVPAHGLEFCPVCLDAIEGTPPTGLEGDGAVKHRTVGVGAGLNSDPSSERSTPHVSDTGAADRDGRSCSTSFSPTTEMALRSAAALAPSFTAYCGHSMHLSCALKLNTSVSLSMGVDTNTRCPVCRFEHDSLPLPVPQPAVPAQLQLGVDGEGSHLSGSRTNMAGDAQEPRSTSSARSGGGFSEWDTSGRTLASRDAHTNHNSSCMMCGWTLGEGCRNMGATSSVNTHRGGENAVRCSSLTTAGGGTEAAYPRGDADVTDPSGAALWCCLVCGFMGCDIFNNNHILLHYHQTLHTYAINVHTKHVWDFSGGGYVDRLALNYDDDAGGAPLDGGSSLSLLRNTAGGKLASAVGPNKVVEVNSMRESSASAFNMHGAEGLAAPFRLHNPRSQLSTEDENMVVNRELEAAAREFKRIFSIQMTESRNHYIHQLEKLRSHLSVDAQPDKSAKSGVSWSHRILQSTRNEKEKLEKMLETYDKKLGVARKELEIINKFNSSLSSNLEELNKLTDVKLILLSRMEAEHRQKVLALEKELEVKMGELQQN